MKSQLYLAQDVGGSETKYDGDSIQGVAGGEEEVRVIRFQVKECAPRLALWRAVQLAPNGTELGTRRSNQQVSLSGPRFLIKG